MEHLDSELADLLHEVSALSRKGPFDLSDLEKLTSLYSQAAYLFTYIEGNAKYVDAGVSYKTVKAALFDDVNLRDSLASRALDLMAQVGQVSATWTDALRWFLQSPEQVRAEVETRSAIGGVEDVLRRIDRDRAALLTHLGLGDGVDGGVNAMAAGLRQVAEPATRSKLLLAWHRVGEAYADALAAAMDSVVEKRWQYATALGYRSVAEHGFALCDVSPKTVRTFLEAFTANALRERRVFLSRFEGAGALDDEVRELSLLADGRDRKDGRWPAAVDFSALLELITETVWCEFHIALNARPAEVGTVWGFDVTKGADTLGTLVLDRAVEGRPAPVLGPECDLAVPERPRARLLCLTASASSETISFKAAQQILHAMGHALVHLVVRPRVPSASGLDILPLERLEGLSHWFEELMDDDVFEERVAFTSEQRVALEAFRRARDERARNTRLEQAVVATIDLDVHRQRGYGVRDAFDARIAEMGGSVGVSFERVVRFMAAPLFRDHPGMGFVYPWGAAFGTTQTRSAIGKRPVEPSSLAAYFDLGVAIAAPDADANFSTVPHSDSD